MSPLIHINILVSWFHHILWTIIRAGMIFFVFLFGQLFGNSAFAAPPVPEIVVYTYDSFISPDGLGPVLFSLFEKKTGCRVRAISSGDAGQLLSRVELDAKRQKQVANLVLGVDQFLWERIKPSTEPWEDWIPKGYSNLSREIQLEKGFLPYSYGVLSFMADREELKKLKLMVPSSIFDLLRPEWKRNFVLEDPRTSTPGLIFLLYLNSIFKNSSSDIWRQFRNQWLTLAPGWSAAYQLFLKRETPLVWSYVSSQAYHDEHGDLKSDQRRFQALVLKEGSPLQIEGAAILKGNNKNQQKWVKEFLSFMISPEIQKIIPKKNWMMPAIDRIPLPESFKKLPKSQHLISIKASSKEIETTLSQWSLSVGK